MSQKYILILKVLVVIAVIAGGLVWYSATHIAWWIPSVTPAERITPNLDPNKPDQLPLGNGHYSFEGPAKGDLYFCESVRFFRTGSDINGPWIDEKNGVYTMKGKPVVRGSVNWPEASVSFSIVDDVLKMVSNNLPNHPTGIFPIAKDDPAYQYDPNPNPISSQNFRQKFPANPKIADKPNCLSLEPIAYLLNGVAVFSGMDTKGRDAAAYEIQDSCGAHSGLNGTYHYHILYDNKCVGTDAESTKNKSPELLGYALDGFGLYGSFENGKELTTADLDECHGHTSEVMWQGKLQNIYHYNVTKDFPYTIGCYKGELLK